MWKKLTRVIMPNRKLIQLISYTLLLLLTLSVLLIFTLILVPPGNVPLPPAVVIELTTGMGNQLFKFASAYALSKYLEGVPLYFVFNQKENDLDLRNPLTRTFMLDKFQVPITHENTLSEYFYYVYILFSGSAQKYSCQDLFEGVVDKGDKYFVTNDYCHSQEYFKSYTQDILQFFQFSKEFLNATETSKVLQFWKRRVTRTKEISVFVHIRLGDYLKPERNAWVTPMSFYESAMNLMINKFCGKKGRKIVNFFIFSDSIDIAKENLKLSRNSTCLDVNYYFVSSKELTSVEEFYLMTMCLHAIISNSTFSWWAAYLIKNKKKMIIAPAHNPKTLEYYSDLTEKSFSISMQKFNYPVQWVVLNPY